MKLTAVAHDPDWDVILNRTAAMPLMIVDGYTIILKWRRRKMHMVGGKWMI